MAAMAVGALRVEPVGVPEAAGGLVAGEPVEGRGDGVVADRDEITIVGALADPEVGASEESPAARASRAAMRWRPTPTAWATGASAGRGRTTPR